MHKLRSSRVYMRIPVDPPDGAGDITAYPPEAALIADDGTEPVEADWHGAIWLDGEVALLVGPGGSGAVDYPAGDYMAFARLTAGPEQPVMTSGRVRIGPPP